MELTTTRVYAILDTLEATVILTMTTVVPLHVFMVSDGLNLGAHWPINGWTHAIALVAKEAKFHFSLNNSKSFFFGYILDVFSLFFTKFECVCILISTIMHCVNFSESTCTPMFKDLAEWNSVILNSQLFWTQTNETAFSVIYYQYLTISSSVIANSPLFQTDFCFPWPKLNSVLFSI